MGWIKPTVSMIIGASLGYYLGDLLGSYIQVHVWDFIGSFIKYFVVVVAVLLGIYLGWGLTNKNKDIREESITVLGAVVGATVGFYLGRLLGIYLRELAIVYVWDFIGVIIQYSFLILGTVVGAGVGAGIPFDIMEENRLKNVVPYEDTKDKPTEELLTVEELMIQTAFYMSNIDGNVNEKEGKLITSFGEKLLKKKSSKEDYLRNKEKINGYIKNAQKDVKNNRVNIHNVLAEINKKCTIDEKKFLFETCLYIAKADGAANNSELKFVKSLVKNMCLNKVESKIMIEKILSTDSSQKENEKKIEKSLGISSNMSNEAILEILKQEYKKWNQRVGLSEPAKREKAEMMLHKIAELRQKYKN